MRSCTQCSSLGFVCDPGGACLAASGFSFLTNWVDSLCFCCHVNVAGDELRWGNQVQASHGDNNNKVGKQ